MNARLSLVGQVMVGRGGAAVRKLMHRDRLAAFLTGSVPLEGPKAGELLSMMIGGVPFRSAVACLCDCDEGDID
jgi:hypothetical protein